MPIRIETLESGKRPYLVVSNSDRPFFGEEYTVAVITTKGRDPAIEVTPEMLTEGLLHEYPSFVNPWSLHVFQHDAIDQRVAQLGPDRLETVSDRIFEFVRVV